MPTLASCYFCGEPLDALQGQYDVPTSGDEQVSVTLCAQCESKLDALLERAATPADASGTAAPDVAAGSPPEVEGEPPDDESEAMPAEAGAKPVDETVEVADDGLGAAEESHEPVDGGGGTAADAPAGAGEASDPAASEEVASTESDPSTNDAGADDPAADDAPHGESEDEGPDDVVGEDESTVPPEPIAGDPEPVFDPDHDVLIGEEPDEDGSLLGGGAGPKHVDVEAELAETLAAGLSEDEVEESAIAPEPGDGDGAGREVEEDADYDTDRAETIDEGSGESTASQEPGDGAGEPASDGSGGNSGASDSEEGPSTAVDPRTYNRVVRLLQNREFPVDREDFEVLATSAYELDPGECGAALDAAIEKGLLAEREGELRRPE